jgi:hypothetical protein
VSDLHWIVAVPHFNDLYVADLELLVILIGILNCGSNNCCWCEKQQRRFGEGSGRKWTQESLYQHYQTYQTRKAAGTRKGNKTKPIAKLALSTEVMRHKSTGVQLEVEGLCLWLTMQSGYRLTYKNAMKDDKM